MLDVARCTCSGFSRNIWLGLSSGCGWTTQGHPQSCLYASLAACFGSLSCWKVNLLPSLRLWMLWTGFSLKLSKNVVHWAFLLLWRVPQSLPLKNSPTAWGCYPAHFTFGMILCRWWAEPGLLQTWCLELRFIRQDNIISHSLRVLLLFSCIYTEERIESCHTAIKHWSVECCSNACPSVDFSYLHTRSWSSTRLTIRFLSPH